jgi:D-alanine transaminase
MSSNGNGHSDWSTRPCIVNGELMALGAARVSPLDRGFLFGDGVYEALPVYGRKLFRVDDHLARLERNLGKLRIDNPHTRSEWVALVRRLVAALAEFEGATDQLVYLQVTRGTPLPSMPARDHVMPQGIAPTVFMMVHPLRLPSAQQRHEGVACVTARDFRWERGDIKSSALLGNVLARQISADEGAVETILLREGPGGGKYLTEASASNVWVVKDGAVIGSPKSEHVLEGIRVELLRELCEEEGIAYSLRPVPESDLLTADEVLLSSATKEVLPVTRIDGEAVGHGARRGKPGPVGLRLLAAYQRAKAEQCT